MKSADEFLNSLERGFDAKRVLSSLAQFELRYIDRIPIEVYCASQLFRWRFFPVRRLRFSDISQLQIREATYNPTVGDLLDAYIAEEHLLEIKSRKAGERTTGEDDLAYSTAISYLSLCKRIRGAWGDTKLDGFKPLAFQKWLKELKAEPKTKGHLKAFVNRLFYKAKLYGMLSFYENPIGLVEVRGISKRTRKPVVLTVEQFWLIFALVKEPYNIMIVLAQCTGLRVSEVLALKWSAIEFEHLLLVVKEAVVHGRIGFPKTEYSKDAAPLDPEVGSDLLDWKRKSKGTGLVFPSPITGHSYDASPIQQDWIRRAGWCLVECPECGAAPGVACSLRSQGRGKRYNIPVHDTRRESATKNGFGSIGWHTFRHTYRALLSKLKTQLDVQKTLMRQADISTTLKYRETPMENLRTANCNVVREILIRRSSK
jgi:integrase